MKFETGQKVLVENGVFEGKTGVIIEADEFSGSLYLIEFNDKTRNWVRKALIIEICNNTAPIRSMNLFIPDPIRDVPEKGTMCYIPHLSEKRCFIDFAWHGLASHDYSLQRGLIHLTKEAAIAHAEAMLSLTKKEEK